MTEETYVKNLTISPSIHIEDEEPFSPTKIDRSSPFKKQATMAASKTASLMKKSRTITTMKNRGFKKQIRFIKENYRNLLYKPYYDIDIETLHSFEIFCGALKDNKKLEHLDISGLTIHPFMVIKLAMAINNHSSLQSLNLSNTSISNLGVKYLCGMLKSNTTLKKLNLFNNLIIRENLQDFEELLRRNKGLREINFNYCNLDGDCVRVFAEILKAKSSLTNIKLAKEDITIPAARALSDYLASKPKLEELDLSNNQINHEVLGEMVKSLHKRIIFRKWRFPTIKKLNLTMNRLNNSEAMENLIYLLSRVLGLKSLNLTKNFLTSENLKILQKIQLSLTDLEELNLSRNIIANNFPNDFFPNVLKLDLSHNRIGRSSVLQIAEHLKKNCSWRVLNLSNNLLESEDLNTLLQSLVQNTNLETLLVAFNFIKDEAFNG
jgi:Ran GTPase-activating protein (RanGAP) involved in mRNA processing and transport